MQELFIEIYCNNNYGINLTKDWLHYYVTRNTRRRMITTRLICKL